MRRLLGLVVVAGILWPDYALAQQIEWDECRENTGATPTPDDGFTQLYCKDNAGVTWLYWKDSTGTEHDLGAAGGGGAPTTAKYITAQDDAGLSADVFPSADDMVPVSDSSSAATWRAVPNCTDSAGQHLNYTSATNAFSCGTTGSGGTTPTGTGYVHVTAGVQDAASDLVTLTSAADVAANQGTTTTLFHGNAAGQGSFGAVSDADLNLGAHTINKNWTFNDGVGASPTLSFVDNVVATTFTIGATAGQWDFAVNSAADKNFSLSNIGAGVMNLVVDGTATLGSPLETTSGGTGASNTPTSGRYLRANGTDFLTSSVAAAGAGACGAGAGVTATVDNAAPTCDANVAFDDEANTFTSAQTLDDGSGDPPQLIFSPQTGTTWRYGVLDSSSTGYVSSNTGSTETYAVTNFGAGVANLTVEGTVVASNHPASADDGVIVGDSATASTNRTLPNCTDTAGNHLNYTQGTNSFSCGTTSSGGGSTPTGTGYRHVTAGVEDAASDTVTFANSSEVQANQGTTTTVLHGNAAGQPSFGTVSLTADVSGTLPLASGGTNNSAAASAGAVIYSDSTKHLPSTVGTAGLFLISGGTGAPTWGPTYLTATATQADAVIATYTAITGIAFTPAANTKYRMSCIMLYSSTAATTGINYAWDVPTAVNFIHMTGYTTTTALGANEGFSQRADNVGTPTTSAVITVTNVAYLEAILSNGANATSTTLGFTPETANSVSSLPGGMCTVTLIP